MFMRHRDKFSTTREVAAGTAAPGAAAPGAAARAALVMLAVFLLPVSTAIARDGLYAPSRPEDAALVRAVNVSSAEHSPVIDIGSLRIEPLAPGEASPYHVVPAGVYMIGGQGGTVFTPEPETFVTIVAGYDEHDPSAMRLFSDAPHDDPARGQLVLYNLTDRTLSLVAVRPEATVFDGVDAGESAAIAVNAVTVKLEVRDGPEVIAEQTVSLVRGGSHALFASHESSVDARSSQPDFHVFLVEASVSDE
jgi:hypothetical protein